MSNNVLCFCFALIINKFLCIGAKEFYPLHVKAKMIELFR